MISIPEFSGFVSIRGKSPGSIFRKTSPQNEQEIEEVREAYTSTLPPNPKDDPIPHRNFMPAAGMSEHSVDRPRPDDSRSGLDMLRHAIKHLHPQFQQKSKPGQGGTSGSTPAPAT